MRMANPRRSHSSKRVPDPARSYERAKPEDESGMGRLDNNTGTPSSDPDRMHHAVPNAKQPGQAAEPGSSTPHSGAHSQDTAPRQPEHSMLEEEPDGWDM